LTANGDRKFFYGYIIVLLATLIMAVTWGAFYSFGIFFKPVLLEFGWSRAAISVSYSLGFMVSGLFAIFAGRLSDRFGPRVVMTTCGLLVAAGYLLTSRIDAIWQLYLFYGIVGIGSSGAYVPSISAITRWFVKRRGLMTGIAMAGIGLGTMIMSPLANWLISNYGWRASYVIVGIIAFVTITAAAQFLKRDPAKMGMRPYGEAEPESLNSSDRGFSYKKAVSTKQFWMLCAMFAFVEYSVHNINVHIIPHTTDLAISAANAANILAIIGAMSVISRVVMGAVGDRISNKPAAITCFVLMLASLIWLLFAQELWMFYLFATIFGFAYGGYQPLISLLVADSFGLSSLGVILGALTGPIMAGAAVGPALAGKIFDVTGSYHLAFSLCAALSVVAIILASLLKSGTDASIKSIDKPFPGN